MTDPFFNGGGDCFIGVPGLVVRMSQARIAADKAISAYRNNIARPDLHVADRFQPLDVKVLAEDGQELTLERRQKLMEGKPTMIDENGNIRNVNYVELFEGEIESERLGKSAEDNRPGYRIARPKELVIPFEVTEDMLKGLEGSIIHEVNTDMGCVYTTGISYVSNYDKFSGCLQESFRRLAKEGTTPNYLYMSSTVLRVIKKWCEEEDLLFSENVLWGCKVAICNELEACIRVIGDPEKTPQIIFASIFISRDLYEDTLAQEETQDYPKIGY
jgi:hypothetical protein